MHRITEGRWRLGEIETMDGQGQMESIRRTLLHVYPNMRKCILCPSSGSRGMFAQGSLVIVVVLYYRGQTWLSMTHSNMPVVRTKR